MSTYDEDLHPRETTGRFATKPTTEADGGLSALVADQASLGLEPHPQPVPEGEPGVVSDAETLHDAGVGAGLQHLIDARSLRRIAERVRAAAPAEREDTAFRLVTDFHRFREAYHQAPLRPDAAEQLAREAGHEYAAARAQFRWRRFGQDPHTTAVAARDLETCYSRKIRADADVAAIRGHVPDPRQPDWWRGAVDQARERVVDRSYRGALHESVEVRRWPIR